MNANLYYVFYFFLNACHLTLGMSMWNSGMLERKWCEECASCSPLVILAVFNLKNKGFYTTGAAQFFS